MANNIKNEIIVHIGMHKTGSSSIQESLYEGIESDTMRYLDLDTANHSGRIFSLFSREKISYAHKRRGSSANQIKNFNLQTRTMLLDSINNCDHSIMIMSGEGITLLEESDLISFRDFFCQYFKKITIVGYVRTARSFAQSAFQQRVKGGLDNFNLENLYPKYRNRFEKFDIVFGRENVKLWKFDPKSFPEGNVVLDFCNRLGITIKAKETIRVNESLSREALSLLYIYRKYGPDYGVGVNVISENDNIVNALKDIGNTKIKFSPSLMAPVIEKNKKDILWMEERLGEVLAESIELSIEDIRSEEDLLKVDEASFQKLSALLGYHTLPKGETPIRPQEVSDLIQALRMKLAGKIIKNSIEGDDEMKLIELAQKVQKENEEQLGKMNEKIIAMIIREAFEQINIEIKKTDDGKINIPRLGKFIVRMTEKEEEGKSVMIKRIIFKPIMD